MSQETNNSRTPNSSGPNPGQRSSRGGTRGDRGRQQWNRTKQNKSTFVRQTKEMNDNVFQFQVEQKRKGQYQETVDQLQVYLASVYKKDIRHLKVLFTQLEKPVIVRPKPPVDDNVVDNEVFKEEIRQYTKDK